jgi:hypothetical protein
MAFLLTALTGMAEGAAAATAAGTAATAATAGEVAAGAGAAAQGAGATSRLASMTKGINEAAEGIKKWGGVTPESEKMAQEHQAPASASNATAGMGAGGTSLTGY